jgi:hypothetical protein
MRMSTQFSIDTNKPVKVLKSINDVDLDVMFFNNKNDQKSY